jgi:hypothetical protein
MVSGRLWLWQHLPHIVQPNGMSTMLAVPIIRAAMIRPL